MKLPNAEKQLNNEIQWIKKTKVLGKNTRDSFVIPSIFNPLILSHFDILKYICNPKHCFKDLVINSGEVIVEDALLEGHLGITRELLAFQSPEKKYNIGSEKGGSNLIRV